MKIKFDKIPFLFKNCPLGNEVAITSAVPALEGTVLAIEAGDHEGKLNVLDFISKRLGRLWKGDIIPAVLGYRKATTEFAGFVPKTVVKGDSLHLLCESGLVGEISGVYEEWGSPMKVKVLGAVLNDKGKPMNLKDYKLKSDLASNNKIPLIVFLGTRMDCGKTTMACKIAHKLTKSGVETAAVKLTGVAFSQDPMKLADAGADPVLDFVDMGLPSTCNGKKSEIVKSALKLIEIVKEKDPEIILAEFGDAVFGEYHVADVLTDPLFKKQIRMVILAANDLSGIKGTKDILNDWGIDIDLVTGPIVNSRLGVGLVKKYFNLEAESNQHDISLTMEIIKKKLLRKI